MIRIITPFGPRSTADEVVKGIDLTGRRAVVTGAASGLGVETARALALAGAEVTLAVRDPAAGGTVAANITATIFEDCNEAEVVARRTPDYRGVEPYALDQGNADRLWEESLRMIA